MLVLKHVPIRSFNENIAYLHKDCSIYKIDNIKSLTRIEIHGGKQPVFAFFANCRQQQNRAAGRAGA